jgi:hypothetical protein
MNRVQITIGRFLPTLMLLSLPAASLPAASIAAEQSSIASLVQAGKRVRVTMRIPANADPLIGTFRAATAESVEVSQPDPHGGPKRRLSIPVDDLASIEVSRGRTHHTLAGSLVGILAGAAAAHAFSSGGDEMSGFVIVFLVPMGALTGAFVGSGIGTERWEKVWEQPAHP